MTPTSPSVRALPNAVGDSISNALNNAVAKITIVRFMGFTFGLKPRDMRTAHGCPLPLDWCERVPFRRDSVAVQGPPTARPENRDNPHPSGRLRCAGDFS